MTLPNARLLDAMVIAMHMLHEPDRDMQDDINAHNQVRPRTW